LRSRRYSKKIEIWQITKVADGYGGATVSEALLSNSWGNVRTVGSNARLSTALVNLGISDPKSAIIVNMRYRKDLTYNPLDMYLKYRGVKYVIMNAVNINLSDTEIEIVAAPEQS
jgi:head-tail adaptor